MQKMTSEEMRETLLHQKKNGYDLIRDDQKAEMNEYARGYRRYLDAGKTEREAVQAAIRLAEAEGFRPFVRGMELHPGDKVYRNVRGKSLFLAVIGEESLAHGVNLSAAHIDCPRLDLKPAPLCEQDELSYLKTHYYGGIRKYQWHNVPMELHGVVGLADGSTVEVCIGADEDDPQLIITDLLPHLAAAYERKPLNEAFDGEKLSLLIGSEPFPEDEGSERVKLMTMKLLYDKYGITEEDFLSAELSAVPAYRAREMGLDRSFIGGYGQDDRVCAYASLMGMLRAQNYRRTGVCILIDKEEIGSEGITGMKSRAFDTFMEDLCRIQGVQLGECYENSLCFSADVAAAYDPNFPEVYEKHNSCFINYGVCFAKYTGARGKGGCNDASAETTALARSILKKANVLWQMTELGRIDVGGGGTVAAFIAERDIPTIDAGVPVLSMHSPYELTSKLDGYMCYLAMKALFEY